MRMREKERKKIRSLFQNNKKSTLVILGQINKWKTLILIMMIILIVMTVIAIIMSENDGISDSDKKEK